MSGPTHARGVPSTPVTVIGRREVFSIRSV
jgi:hypothetical protein